MKKIDPRIFIVSSLRATLLTSTSRAQTNTPLTLNASKMSPQPSKAGFKMGTSKNPGGIEFTLDSRSLIVNGRRAMPVMGEFHYSRYPENEWRVQSGHRPRREGRHADLSSRAAGSRSDVSGAPRLSVFERNN